MKVDKEVLPAFLAPALINGDFTSFDDEGHDQRIYDLVIKSLGAWRVIDCGDETWFAPFEFFGISGDVCEYTIVLDEEEQS